MGKVPKYNLFSRGGGHDNSCFDSRRLPAFVDYLSKKIPISYDRRLLSCVRAYLNIPRET